MSGGPPEPPLPFSQEPPLEPIAPDDPSDVFWRSRGWWGRAGQSAAGLWISAGLSFLTTVVGARALSPGEYGSVLLALAIVLLISTFLDITLEEATVFYGSRAIANRDNGGLRALVKLSLQVDIAIGIVVAAALIALAAPLADVASADSLDPSLVRLAAISVLVTTADSTASASLLVVRQAHLRAWGLAATAGFRLIALIIAVQLGGPTAVMISYVIGGALGSVVLGFMAWRVGWRRWIPGPAPAKPPATRWELVRFGFHSSVTTSVYAVYGSLVPLILGRTAGAAAVSIFRIGMTPVVAANMLSAPVRLVMFPEQSKLASEGRLDELQRSVRGYTKIGFALGTAGAIVAYFAMPWLIPHIFSSAYEDAVTPARILLIAAVFYFALSWGKTLAAAVGRPQIRTVLALVELVVVAGVLVVLGDHGAVGGAIAVSAGSVAVGIAWLILAPRLFRRGVAAPQGAAPESA